MRVMFLMALCWVFFGNTAQAKIVNGKADQAQAAALSGLVDAADKTFLRLPDVYFKKSLKGLCGAGRASNPYVLFCSAERRIYMRTGVVDAFGVGAAGYLLGHVYGHAAQVKYGVATIALATIRANRDREDELRGYVTRQVECVAGVLNNRAGLVDGGPKDWFGTEPLADSHWGASPIARGPVVSIGLDQRHEWFLKGLKSGDFKECSAGVFPADLLVNASR